jgi:hypothetical protein
MQSRTQHTPKDSSIDDEWSKFMNKITNDDDDDDDDEYDDNGKFNLSSIVNSTIGGGGSGCGGGATAMMQSKTGSHKKTCISKKQQRKTYSFIDDFEPRVVNESKPEDSSQCINSGNDYVVSSTAVPTTVPTQTPTTVPTQTPTTVPTQTPTTHHGAPKSTSIYISTKTKIAYLNKPVDIYKVFWDIPVVHYYTRKEAVIKKQIKFQTTNPEDIVAIKTKLQAQNRYYEEQIIEHIDNPTGRIVFKDQRKVSIGLCKKDLLNNNSKKKRAFFNCFVLILRINGGECTDESIKSPKDNILFKEMHVKVFNTGKLEIPGIQDDQILIRVLDLLVLTLRPILGDDLEYVKTRCETVLINSNFNCGYFINRDKLFDLMKYKYRINSNYDSCSYPGIQCKFYYIPGATYQTGQQPLNLDTQKYYEISFMIFRTGSILIVGKCNESILMAIYDFIKNVLETEFHTIQMGLIEQPNTTTTTKQHTHCVCGGGAGGDVGVGDGDDGDGGADHCDCADKCVHTTLYQPKKISKTRRKIIMVGNIEPFHFQE